MEFWTYISACETRNLVWDLNFDREFQRNFNEASIRLREYCGSDLYPLQPRLKMLVPLLLAPLLGGEDGAPLLLAPLLAGAGRMTASLACGGETPAAVRGGAGAGRRPPPARAGGRGGMGRAGRAAAAARLGRSGGGSAHGRAWRAAAAAGLRPKRFTGLRGCAETVKW